MNQHLKTLFLLGLLLATPAGAWANDRSQPVHIRADHAEMDRLKGISIYTGNVVLNQGSLHIEADIIRAYLQDEELELIEAEGQPVRFHQRTAENTADTTNQNQGTNADEPPRAHVPEIAYEIAHEIEGEALQVNYLVGEEKLWLRGSARIARTGDTFSGERIDYDMINGIVRASGKSDEIAPGDGRIHAIIQPRGREQPAP